MTVHLHEEDIPAGLFAPGAAIAVDTETMGLITPRDRLCVVQLSDGGPDEHLVRFSPGLCHTPPTRHVAMLHIFNESYQRPMLEDYGTLVAYIYASLYNTTSNPYHLRPTSSYMA